jgi:hypothetical protein
LAIFVAGAGLSLPLTVVVDVLLTLRESRAQQTRQSQSETAARDLTPLPCLKKVQPGPLLSPRARRTANDDYV